MKTRLFSFLDLLENIPGTTNMQCTHKRGKTAQVKQENKLKDVYLRITKPDLQ